MADIKQYMNDTRDEPDMMSSTGVDDIPPDVWDKAGEIYRMQYGEEGYGGDASMQGTEQIARVLMGGAGGAPTPDPKQAILQKMMGGGRKY